MRTTAPDGQQRGTSQPIVEERSLITLPGRVLESRVQLLRPDPPGRRNLQLLLRVHRSVQRWRCVRRCQRLHLRLHGLGRTENNDIYMYVCISCCSITLDLSYPISRSRRYVYISHMTPIAKGGERRGGKRRQQVLSSLLSRCSLEVAGSKKKKKNEDNVSSRVGAELNANGRSSRFQDQRLPDAEGDTVAPPTVPRTLDTPVGGSTSTGAELPGQDDPSRRRDARSPVLPTLRNVLIQAESGGEYYRGSGGHRAAGSRCRFYAPP